MKIYLIFVVTFVHSIAFNKRNLLPVIVQHATVSYTEYRTSNQDLLMMISDQQRQWANYHKMKSNQHKESKVCTYC